MKRSLGLFLLFVAILPAQACDSSSEFPVCPRFEICKNNECVDYDSCSDDSECPSGESCIDFACNPDPCTSTGQCVSGMICALPEPRRCVEIEYEEQLVGGDVFFEPWSEEFFDEPALEIKWFKGSRDSLAVWASPILPGGIAYFGDFCSGSSPCSSTEKASLNLTTGALIIYDIQLSDEDFYYVSGYIPGQPLFGTDEGYFVPVLVVPTEEEMTIEGLPEVIEDGSTVELTCIIERIKPIAADIYWHFDGNWYNNGTMTFERNSDGKTYRQQGVMEFTFYNEDDLKQITCTFNHASFVFVTAKEIVHMAGDTGKSAQENHVKAGNV